MPSKTSKDNCTARVEAASKSAPAKGNGGQMKTSKFTPGDREIYKQGK